MRLFVLTRTLLVGAVVLTAFPFAEVRADEAVIRWIESIGGQVLRDGLRAGWPCRIRHAQKLQDYR